MINWNLAKRCCAKRVGTGFPSRKNIEFDYIAVTMWGRTYACG